MNTNRSAMDGVFCSATTRTDYQFSVGQAKGPQTIRPIAKTWVQAEFRVADCRLAVVVNAAQIRGVDGGGNETPRLDTRLLSCPMSSCSACRLPRRAIFSFVFLTDAQSDQSGIGSQGVSAIDSRG